MSCMCICGDNGISRDSLDVCFGDQLAGSAHEPMSRNPQVDHQNIHQVAHDIPLSPQINTARHTSSVLKSKTQSSKITSRGKLNSLKRLERGRNIIGSKYNSKARDTSRSYHLKNTREREIKHIATGTYPQPRG